MCAAAATGAWVRRRNDRAIIRRVTCRRGAVECVSACAPARDFTAVDLDGLERALSTTIMRWCSVDELSGPRAARRLQAGDRAWLVLATGTLRTWTVEAAERAFSDTERFWADAIRSLGGGSLDPRLVRFAVTIRMLEYAPSGSAVAAPTTSLPERIGGGWNADYRLTWVRDASLAIAALAQLGDRQSPRRYFDWILTLDGTTKAPLQCRGLRARPLGTRWRMGRAALGSARPDRRFGGQALARARQRNLGAADAPAVRQQPCDVVGGARPRHSNRRSAAAQGAPGGDVELCPGRDSPRGRLPTAGATRSAHSSTRSRLKRSTRRRC